MEPTIRTIENELGRISSLARVLSVVFLLAAIVYAAGSSITSYVGLVALFEPHSDELQRASGMVAFVPFLLKILVVTAVLLLACAIMHKLGNGESPFSAGIYKIVMAGAVLSLVLVVAEIAWGPAVSAMDLAFNNGLLRYAANGRAMFSPIVDAGSIGLAAVMLIYACITKYGSLLQELSDETV